MRIRPFRHHHRMHDRDLNFATETHRVDNVLEILHGGEKHGDETLVVGGEDLVSDIDEDDVAGGVVREDIGVDLMPDGVWVTDQGGEVCVGGVDNDFGICAVKANILDGRGMYRGRAPSPLRNRIIPCVASKTAVVPSSDSQIRLQLSNPTVVEVLLEVVGVKNLPEGRHKGNLLVFFSKKTFDVFLDGKRRLCILSESRKKRVACFQCEPSGELCFELMSSSLPVETLLGTTSISLQNMLPELSLEKWFELEPSSGTLYSEPITMRIAISITTPTPGPHVLHMLQSRTKGWTCVVDGAGNEIIKIQMRNLKKAVAENENPKREVVGIVGGCGETHVLATFSETGWSVMDSSRFILQIQKKSKEDGSIFELSAENRLVQLFTGREPPESCST